MFAFSASALASTRRCDLDLNGVCRRCGAERCIAAAASSMSHVPQRRCGCSGELRRLMAAAAIGPWGSTVHGSRFWPAGEFSPSSPSGPRAAIVAAVGWHATGVGARRMRGLGTSSHDGSSGGWTAPALLTPWLYPASSHLLLVARSPICLLPVWSAVGGRMSRTGLPYCARSPGCAGGATAVGRRRQTASEKIRS